MADRGVVGVASVTIAALLFGVVAVLVKFATVPPLILLQFRSVVQLLLSFIALALLKAARGADRSNFLWLGPRPLWGYIGLRSLLYWAFISCWWLALTSLPVGDATCVVYLGPIFSALFARLLLGERLPPVFPVCIALSLTGTALVTLGGGGAEPAPGSDSTANSAARSVGVASALCSAVAGGLLPVLTRKSKEAHWATIELWSAAGSSFIFTPIGLLVWFYMPSIVGFTDSRSERVDKTREAVTAVLHFQPLLAIILALSLVGFAGLGLQTYGYQREEAARASMMTFLEVPFAYLMQWQVFGDVLTWLQAVGMSLIVLSCIVNVRHKLQAASDAKSTARGGRGDVRA